MQLSSIVVLSGCGGGGASVCRSEAIINRGAKWQSWRWFIVEPVLQRDEALAHLLPKPAPYYVPPRTHALMHSISSALLQGAGDTPDFSTGHKSSHSPH